MLQRWQSFCLQHIVGSANTALHLFICTHWMTSANSSTAMWQQGAAQKEGFCPLHGRRTSAADGWTGARLGPRWGHRQINLKQTLIGCKVIIMTGGLEPKAGGCGAAHPRGVMCLWLTVNPSCLVDRRSSTVRSTHHCDSYCSSDLGLHQEGCTHFLRNVYKCKQLIQSN